MKIRRIGIAIALAMITFTGLGALSSSKDIALRKCQRYDLEKEPGKAVNCYEEVVLGKSVV